MLCSWTKCSWSVASSLFLVIETTFTQILPSTLPKFSSRTAQCNTTNPKEAGTPCKPYITLQLASSADVHTGTHALPQSGYIILFRFRIVWKNLPSVPYVHTILAEVRNIITLNYNLWVLGWCFVSAAIPTLASRLCICVQPRGSAHQSEPLSALENPTETTKKTL